MSSQGATISLAGKNCIQEKIGKSGPTVDRFWIMLFTDGSFQYNYSMFTDNAFGTWVELVKWAREIYDAYS